MRNTSTLVYLSFLLLPSFSFSRDIVHIQTDRQNYLAGETVYFKAYVLSEGKSEDYSTNLFLELINDSGKAIHHYQFPIFNASSIGSLQLDTTMGEGIYLVRAYTNCNNQSIAENNSLKTIYVFNPQDRYQVDSSKRGYQFNLLTPHIIAGLQNSIRFRFLGPGNQPIVGSGTLLNSKNETVLQFKTTGDGFGEFKFKPLAGETYSFSILLPDGSKVTSPLPLTLSGGAVMEIASTEKGKLLNISFSPGYDGQDMSITGLMENMVVFNHEFRPSNGNYKSLVPIKNLTSGPLQILLSDHNDRVLAKTATFVINPNSFVSIKLRKEELNSPPDHENKLVMEFPDSTIGNFSVSITDFDQQLKIAQQDIYSSFLSAPYFHSPATGINRSLIDASSEESSILDLLISESKWKSGEDGLETDKNPKNCPIDSNYLQIRGKVYSKDKKKLITKGELNIVFIGKDSSSSILSVPIAKDGSFTLKNLIYYDTATFRYSLNKKKEEDIFIELERKPSQGMTYDLSNFYRNYSVFRDTAFAQMMKKSYDAIKGNDKYEFLEPVTFSTGLTPTQKVNNKYSRGLFQNTNMVRIIDLVNYPADMNGINILEYLQGRIPGLFITKSGSDYLIYSQRRNSIGTPPPARIFLNEMEATADQVADVPIYEIALVKYFPPGGSVLPNIGAADVLAIYTKKIEDLSWNQTNELNGFTYPGYSLFGEWPSQNTTKTESSHSTLYWNPNIFLDGLSKNREIQFLNPNGAKKILITIEGITDDGRLLHLEEVIAMPPK